MFQALSPANAGLLLKCFRILGLTPQALCFRPLRGLRQRLTLTQGLQWIYAGGSNSRDRSKPQVVFEDLSFEPVKRAAA